MAVKRKKSLYSFQIPIGTDGCFWCLLAPEIDGQVQTFVTGRKLNFKTI